VRIPIPDLLIRLRTEAQAATASATALDGRGAAHSALTTAIWRGWALIYSRPALYRWATWLMSRLRALTPRSQGGWTSCRTPIKPARRRLRDLLAQTGAGGHSKP
jgi:L-lactate dehydrogenase complex protein LldF